MALRVVWLLGTVAAVFGGAPVQAASMDELIRSVKTVGKEGAGNEAAMKAVKELSRGSGQSLLPLLSAMDDASPLAANWLRGAFEAVASRELKSTRKLPAKELEAFLIDKQHQAHPRRLAYEWLVKVDPTAEDRLIPGMLRDPGAEFRRDAVQRLIDQAVAAQEKNDQPAAIKLFQEALLGATDNDQVQAIVKPLKELGETVNLQKHFGFLTTWKLIGPFENHELVGFDAVYPPEEKLNFSEKYIAKDGMEVAWQDYRTEDEYGVVDLRKALAAHKGAVVYAAAEFTASVPMNVELRLGTPNAWKLWANGELAFARDEYHRGTQLDQYRVPVKLQAGKNVILIKVCQNEQTEEWAQDWKYQLRVSDSSGAAIEPAGD